MRFALAPFIAIAALCAAAVPAAVAQDTEKEVLRRVLKDVDLAGPWIYDDIDAGFAQAKKAGKPMLVVFR